MNFPVLVDKGPTSNLGWMRREHEIYVQVGYRTGQLGFSGGRT